MRRAASRQQSIVPTTFTRMSVSSTAPSKSSTRELPPTPGGVDERASSVPDQAMVSSNSRTTSDSTATASAAHGDCARAPPAASSETESAAPSARGDSSRRPRSPRGAAPRAAAAPTPREPPVISTVPGKRPPRRGALCCSVAASRVCCGSRSQRIFHPADGKTVRALVGHARASMDLAQIRARRSSSARPARTLPAVRRRPRTPRSARTARPGVGPRANASHRLTPQGAEERRMVSAAATARRLGAGRLRQGVPGRHPAGRILRQHLLPVPGLLP